LRCAQVSRIADIFLEGTAMTNEEKTLKFNTEVGVSPTVSLLQSKQEIDEIEMAMEDLKQHKNHTISGANKKQISKGVTIDWK
jgi:hypothetical protein